jgi:hypothetical protein
MKRLFVALCLLVAPAALRAQACAASPCNATPVATWLVVKSSVTFAPNGAVDFGFVASGGSAVADPQGVTGLGSPAGVILSSNQAVTVKATFSPLSATGFPDLTVSSPTCGWSTVGTTSVANTTLFTCSTGYTSPAAGTGAGGLYVWLGGTVNTLGSTPAGNYSGSATVVGTYTAY